jgi:hypothetical protein
MKCFGLSAADIPADAFWDRAIVRNGCWGWCGFRDKRGYARMTVRTAQWARSVGAHRASWVLHNGDITADHNVLHHCDNPECVNPAHLYLGTHAQNMRDMKERGRAKGRCPPEKAHCAKLSFEKAAEIRALKARMPKLSHAAIAAQYGVTAGWRTDQVPPASIADYRR